MSNMDDAVREYLRKHKRPPELIPTPDGYWIPPFDDRCPLCENAKWVVSTGSHLKTMQHIAAKHGVNPFDLKKAHKAHLTSTTHGNIVFKALMYKSTSQGAEMLVSPSRSDHLWLPHSVNISECNDSYSPCVDGPQTHCHCGYYCYWDLDEATRYSDSDSTIIVKLKIGGRIVEYTEGARAQCAVIVGIYSGVNRELAHRVALLYNVPRFEQQEEDDECEILDTRSEEEEEEEDDDY